MAGGPMYHDGMRRLQDARETEPLADRLEEATVHTAFTAEDRAFIQHCSMLFAATRDADGHPDCSYKDGLPGFVRVLDGTAQISEDDPLRSEFPGSVFVVRVAATRIFLNRPRYIHNMKPVEHSVYAPRPDFAPPTPAWKTFDAFRDALPECDRQGDGKI